MFENDSESASVFIMRHTSISNCFAGIINCQGSLYQYTPIKGAVGCSEILTHV